jgi:opacity protein-like surface antigen
LSVIKGCLIIFKKTVQMLILELRLIGDYKNCELFEFRAKVSLKPHSFRVRLGVNYIKVTLMKSSILALTTSLTIATIATQAQAQPESNNYWKLGANVTSASQIDASGTTFKYRAKMGILPEFTYGRILNNDFSLEVSYQQSGGAMKDSTVGGTLDPATAGNLLFNTLMVKAIYQIPAEKSDNFNPYAGLGIGQTTIKIDGHLDASSSAALNADGTATSLQLTLGNRFNFSENWFGDLALNVTQVGKSTLTDDFNNKGDIKATNLTSMSFAVGSRF